MQVRIPVSVTVVRAVRDVGRNGAHSVLTGSGLAVLLMMA